MIDRRFSCLHRLTGRVLIVFAAALGFCLAPPSPAAAQDSTQETIAHMLRLMSADVARQPHLKCLEWGYTPLDSSRIIDYCYGQGADTIFKAYRTKAGQPIAANEQFFVQPQLALKVIDSLRANLTKSLGAALVCRPLTMGTLKENYVWNTGPYSVLLVHDDGGPPPKGFPKIDFSWVGVQVAISTPTFSCDDWIPGRN